MIKYNLYRLKKESQEALVKKLESVNLVKAGEKDVNGFKYEFFFSQKPDEVDIWWIETYKEFLTDANAPQNKIYFGVLLIENDSILYAVSLGKSHFYLRQFCDSDFGLNLAERIADKDDLRIKNSKFYRSKKSKIITTYQKGTEIDFDSGESMHYLKVKTTDEALWGKIASFGSSVQFTLSLQPNELTALVDRIEKELQKPPQLQLPKAELIKDDEVIKRLDKKLCDEILASSAIVNIDELAVSGVDFIFTDRSNYSLFLKGFSSLKTDVGELTLSKLVDFCNEKNFDLYEDINNIQVYSANESERGHSQPLKTYLDYVDDERHCLIDGKWHRFNASFITYLSNEVNAIQWNHEARFDISSTINEDEFNKKRAENDMFRNFDKELESLSKKYRIEKMDLYKDGVLHFVKIGVPQKLGYVIDQALLTVNILQNNTSRIEIDSSPISITGICLWIVLDRKRRLEKLSDINSIIFHMKLVEWKKVVTNAGFTPSIKLNYVV
jgi:uncharacterized protein (TIGR04141 family)